MPDFLVFATIVPRLLGAKVILDIHDPMADTFTSKFQHAKKNAIYNILVWQERASAAYCNKVITVHHPVRDHILTRHGLKSESIEVIANFADDELFQIRDEYHIDGIIRLVFHGTILKRSGLGILMTALSQVRHKDRIRCRIIGEGDYEHTLRDLIRSNQLSDVVEFDNHFYPVYEMPDRLADCHIGVIPLEISGTTNYALPVKLIEYIDLGLPVITVRSNAIMYYFKEGDCIFYEWNDASSLAAIIGDLAENPSRLLHYRARSLALREHFLWANEKKKYIKLLREITPCFSAVKKKDYA
jgi:glycosyltransferase involved in cell wall biosynthesis